VSFMFMSSCVGVRARASPKSPLLPPSLRTWPAARSFVRVPPVASPGGRLPARGPSERSASPPFGGFRLRSFAPPFLRNGPPTSNPATNVMH